MAIETRTYSNGEIYTLARLDHVLALRHNIESLRKAGIHEKRVFLHNQEDSMVEKEVRYPLTNHLMMGIHRVIWGLEADCLNMGLYSEIIDIAEKYSKKGG